MPPPPSPDVEPLHVGRPNLGDRARFLSRLDAVLDSRMLSNGPFVAEFERRVAAVAGVRHCVAVCNATTGLQLAVRACGIEPGDQVVVPAFTWIATPHALSWIGVDPVFADVDPVTATLDPAQVEAVVGPRTRAVLGVHVFGRVCDTAALDAVAARHGLAVLYDAAHALGCTGGGRVVGGGGSAEVFSFHATKYLHSFEGGAVVTDDDEVAARARRMRNFGIGEAGEVVSVGTNAKMTEVAAAMGLTSLDHAAEFTAVNRRHHGEYAAGLAGVAGVVLRPPAPGERSNHQYVVIEVDERVHGVSRDAVHAALLAGGVLARRYFSPGCHRSAPYRADPARYAPRPLPHADALAARVLALPTGTAVDAGQVARVCALVRRAVGQEAPTRAPAGLRA